MTLDNYSRVRLVSDDYRDQGVSSGAIGYIIDVHGQEAYEVEFSDENGITIALLAIPQDAVKLDVNDTSHSHHVDSKMR